MSFLLSKIAEDREEDRRERWVKPLAISGAIGAGALGHFGGGHLLGGIVNQLSDARLRKMYAEGKLDGKSQQELDALLHKHVSRVRAGQTVGQIAGTLGGAGAALLLAKHMRKKKKERERLSKQSSFHLDGDIDRDQVIEDLERSEPVVKALGTGLAGLGGAYLGSLAGERLIRSHASKAKSKLYNKMFDERYIDPTKLVELNRKYKRWGRILGAGAGAGLVLGTARYRSNLRKALEEERQEKESRRRGSR